MSQPDRPEDAAALGAAVCRARGETRDSPLPASVVFDLGAVVFHWQPLDLLQCTLPAHAPDAAAARRLAAAIFQNFAPGSDWAAFDLGQVDEPVLAERIARRSGLAADEVLAVIRAIPPALRADGATVALLRRVKAAGHRLFFLSNMPASYALHLQRRDDCLACFDAGVFSSQIGLMKPDPAIYEHAAREFGFAREQAAPVFIDDSEPNVEAARRLGWDAVLYHGAAQCADALAARGLLAA